MGFRARAESLGMVTIGIRLRCTEPIGQLRPNSLAGRNACSANDQMALSERSNGNRLSFLAAVSFQRGRLPGGKGEEPWIAPRPVDELLGPSGERPPSGLPPKAPPRPGAAPLTVLPN